jgi:hypothetical protein
MNAKPILLIVLVLILILLGFGAQIFLTRGLTSVLNDTVFPRLKAQYGLDAGIENAEVQLLKGQAVVTGLTVMNPTNYVKPVLLSAERCTVRIEWKSLLKRDPIVVKQVLISGAELTVERNKEHDINIRDLSDILRNPPKAREPAGIVTQTVDDDTQPAPEESRPATVASKKSKPVSVQFLRIEADGTVLYTDRVLKSKYSLKFELAGNNLFTVPQQGQPSTLLTLRGSLADDPSVFETDLSAFIEPLTDLENPTFNATGSVKNIDPKLIEKLLRKNDLKSGPFSIQPSVACRKGRLDGSSVDLMLTSLEYQNTKIGDTTLHVPVSGTLQKRTYDLTAALQSLFSNNAGNILKAFIKKDKTLNDTPASEPEDSPADEAKPESSASDVLIDKLGKSVKEIDDNPELKKSLRELSNSLFGD